MENSSKLEDLLGSSVDLVVLNLEVDPAWLRQ